MDGPRPGSELGGKYRIVRLLGRGGMGSVFEAENTLTHKRVAIKWMHAELAAQAGAAERLLREAQASARVRHPNVVDIYDVGRDQDTIFLVMEYLEGEPLSALLARGGLSMPRILALLLPAMRAVAAAHRQGVIHRDLKPDNIFLASEADTPQPIPKVLDFGISKLEPRGPELLSLTRSGSTMGTPRYMSYEQLTGDRSIDGRTDVYAFGVILYEALTGRPPYDAESFPELIVKVATQAPISPKELCAAIPTPLARIILWAMAREREQRIATMDLLIRELEPFATEHGFRDQMTLPDESIPGAAVPREEVGPPSRAMPARVAAQPVQGPNARRRLALAVGLLAAAALIVLSLWRAPGAWGASAAGVSDARLAAPPPPPQLPSRIAPVPDAPQRAAPAEPAAPAPVANEPATAAEAPAKSIKKRKQLSPPAAAMQAQATPESAPSGAAEEARPPAAGRRSFRVPSLPKTSDF